MGQRLVLVTLVVGAGLVDSRRMKADLIEPVDKARLQASLVASPTYVRSAADARGETLFEEEGLRARAASVLLEEENVGSYRSDSNASQVPWNVKKNEKTGSVSLSQKIRNALAAILSPVARIFGGGKQNAKKKTGATPEKEELVEHEEASEDEEEPSSASAAHDRPYPKRGGKGGKGKGKGRGKSSSRGRGRAHRARPRGPALEAASPEQDSPVAAGLTGVKMTDGVPEEFDGEIKFSGTKAKPFVVLQIRGDRNKLFKLAQVYNSKHQHFKIKMPRAWSAHGNIGPHVSLNVKAHRKDVGKKLKMRAAHMTDFQAGPNKWVVLDLDPRPVNPAGFKLHCVPEKKCHVSIGQEHKR